MLMLKFFVHITKYLNNLGLSLRIRITQSKPTITYHNLFLWVRPSLLKSDLIVLKISPTSGGQGLQINKMKMCFKTNYVLYSLKKV